MVKLLNLSLSLEIGRQVGNMVVDSGAWLMSLEFGRKHRLAQFLRIAVEKRK